MRLVFYPLDVWKFLLPLMLIAASCAASRGEAIRARNLPAGATNLPAPDVEWISSPNFGGRGSTRVDSIVIHTTEVNFAGTLDIFQDTESQVSAHFVIAPDGHIVQMVDTANRAWHATYYNSRSVGIEMVGYAAQSSTWNNNNLNSLMNLLAWLVTAYDVPLTHPSGNAYDFAGEQYDYPGLVAHGQVQPWNRTDPGPHFPWSAVLAGTQARIDAVPEPTSLGLACLASLLLAGRLVRPDDHSRRRPRRMGRLGISAAVAVNETFESK
ncbi:MAG: N-acetylmuramoyl-L-alanine amidase [Pirellulales bacterium]